MITKYTLTSKYDHKHGGDLLFNTPKYLQVIDQDQKCVILLSMWSSMYIASPSGILIMYFPNVLKFDWFTKIVRWYSKKTHFLHKHNTIKNHISNKIILQHGRYKCILGSIVQWGSPCLSWTNNLPEAEPRSFVVRKYGEETKLYGHVVSSTSLYDEHGHGWKKKKKKTAVIFFNRSYGKT